MNGNVSMGTLSEEVDEQILLVSPKLYFLIYLLIKARSECVSALYTIGTREQ